MTDRNDRSTQDQAAHSSRTFQQRGNIFFALFGAVAVMGVLGAGVMTFMKGPLQSSVKITKMNSAANQMNVAGQMLLSNGASDCDADTITEAVPWDAAITGLTGGGSIHSSVPVVKTDPWGTSYGYCVWNHGTVNTGSCGTAPPDPTHRLNGRANNTDFTGIPIIAIISAGPNKKFGTECVPFSSFATPLVERETAPPALAADGADDIIHTMSYSEAVLIGGGGGGLWTLNSAGTEASVTPTVSIKASGADFGTSTVFLDTIAGKTIPMVAIGNSSLLLSQEGGAVTCNAAKRWSLTFNQSTKKLRFCDTGDVWADASGGGGATPGGADTQVQFNDGGSALGGDTAFVWNKTSNFLGINVTPDVALDVTGDADIIGNLDVTGNITYTGTITDVSDMRLKENIRHLSLGKQLDKLASLNGYAFSMKGDPTQAMEYGLMAQEVEKVYPELVIERTYNDQQVKTLNVQGMVAPMLEGIKELKAENERLRKRLDKLERRQSSAASSH